jgi:hypothetical protein
MKKSTNFTTKKLSLLLALAVAGQLLISVPAQAVASTPAQATTGERGSLFKTQEWVKWVAGLKKCFGQEEADKRVEELKALCQSKECQEVPEPLTILGVGATLAALPAFKKRYAELKKEQ